MRKKVLGFTLIELMIVIAIIAIIAAIAIPGLLRARIAANEGSASAGLRSLASAETSFMKANSVDQDNDGTGEYGVFNELCAMANRRGSQYGPANKPRLPVGDMPVSFQTVSSGYASKSGYCFQVWLPGTAATITDSLPPTPLGFLSTSGADDNAIQQQENRWICYSWPTTYRSSGVRAFVVNEGAEVFASANTNSANAGFYFGSATTNRPVWNHAMMTTPTTPTPVDWQNIQVKTNVSIVNNNHVWLPVGS